MRTMFPALGLAACTVGDRCPEPTPHLDAFACLESTASPTPDPYSNNEDSVSGAVPATVTEIGPLSSIADSAPVGGFPACDDTEHAIRFVDDAGATWTFGWSVAGATDAMPASLPVGTAVTLAYDWGSAGSYSYTRSVVVSDGVGPRLVFADTWPELDLPGMSVKELRRDECVGADPAVQNFAELPLSFEAVNTLVLYSGGTGELDLGSHTLDVLVPNSWTFTECTDGCYVHEWVGWD